MAGGGGNEPNLTPFIDLFSVLVCFLLMTAAWIQLESLQVQVDKKPPEPTASTEPSTPPPPEDKEKKIKLSVQLFADKIVAKEDDQEFTILNAADGVNKQELESLLTGWRQKYPLKKDLVLNTDASVTYGAMIRLYDLMVATDWPDIAINPY